MPTLAKTPSPRRKTAVKRSQKLSSQDSGKDSSSISLRDEVVAYRKERILQAACDAFYEHGYHECTVEMIAERLSGSKAIVYYYFSDKHSILYEIYRRALDEAQILILRAAADHSSCKEKLVAIARAYANWVTDNTRTVGVYWREVQSLTPEARAAVFAEQKKIDDVVAHVIRDGVADYTFKVSDVQTTARAITGMITFTYTWWRDDKRLSREAVADSYAEMALRLVGSFT
ncbi:TetR/AcrR family transcriptional regulator [Alcaligenaceae bacterium]|nr:TetR/AcrR family transcriptional regulator [Alcaligenaceae bacterium]